MINRILRKFGMELQKTEANGKAEQYNLRLQPPHGRIDLTIVDTVIADQPIRFAVNFREDHIQKHHFRGEFYEAVELERMGQYFQGGTLVDIGANIGNHSIYATKFLGATRVIAFEPGPKASTMLKCNIALNDLQNVVEIRQVALSNTTGTATFEDAMPYNLGGARVLVGKPGNVPVMTGDDALRGEHVDFIKIDTEGLELQVLHGLLATLQTQRPRLFIEVDDTNAAAVHDLLTGQDYDIVDKTKSYAAVGNWIAIPR